MQLTFDDMRWMATDDELAPEDTRNMPFFGFMAATVISLGIWCAIAWTVWAALD